MVVGKEPRKVGRRPLYVVKCDRAGQWAVRRRGGRGTLGTFATRDGALARAEELAASHLIAKVIVLGPDGRILLDRHHFDETCRRTAERILGGRMRPFLDAGHAASVLASERDWSLEEGLEICGEALRLRIVLHEGSQYEEIHVFGCIGDADQPNLAEVQDILFPFPVSRPGRPSPK